MTFDDVFNDYDDFIKSLLYREELPIIYTIVFPYNMSGVPVDIEPGTIVFGIESSAYTSYYVKIAYENNNSEIYVRKLNSQPI